MITINLTAEVTEDRRLVITLPPDVPLGTTNVVVTVESAVPKKKLPRTSLADWAEQNAEDWGDRIRSDDVEGFTGRRF